MAFLLKNKAGRRWHLELGDCVSDDLSNTKYFWMSTKRVRAAMGDERERFLSVTARPVCLKAPYFAFDALIRIFKFSRLSAALADARVEIFACIGSYYNTHRKHSALAYLTPTQFEAA